MFHVPHHEQAKVHEHVIHLVLVYFPTFLSCEKGFGLVYSQW